jgi:hypothetical protein
LREVVVRQVDRSHVARAGVELAPFDQALQPITEGLIDVRKDARATLGNVAVGIDDVKAVLAH